MHRLGPGGVAAALAAAALGLSGCASVVFVHTDGQPVRVSFGLGVPSIERGLNDAVAIRSWNAGVYVDDCNGGGIGVSACQEFRFDPRSCGVGIVTSDARHPADHDALAKFADQVLAECARSTEGTTP